MDEDRLWDCCWNPARGYISTISVYNLPRLRTLIDLIKENGYMLKKAKSRWYPAETITNVDDVDDSASCKYTYPSWIPAA